MSAQRIVKRELEDVYLDEVNGCGDELVIKLRAFRKTKAGTPERYDLELKVCRYSVKQLLNGLKAMHARDRERIQRELARIDNEINALKVTP